MALREVGGLRTGDVCCSSQLRRSAPPTGRRGKVRKERHLAYAVAILKAFQWRLLSLFPAFPQCYWMWSTCAPFSLWNVQSKKRLHLFTHPQLPFPGVRLGVVASPVALQRAGAVPNMDFLLFPRSFPLLEPAGDSVDRPVSHKRTRDKDERSILLLKLNTSFTERCHVMKKAEV